MNGGLNRKWGARTGWTALLCLALGIASTGCHCARWRHTLAQDLAVMGHRNWIVVADSAYPAQSRAGIKTIVTGADQIGTVETLLAVIDKAPHVRPIVYVDAELQHVAEKDAPGIDAYRENLVRLLDGRPVVSLPHEEVIARLDEAGETFRVLILKTDMTLPYTSVFVQLDCGYWSAEAERNLRKAIPAVK
jgi:L-fucose mutarotase/ribose pyranase (RbsD/FucU family)